MDLFDNPWVANLVSEFAAALVLLAVGFLIGKYRARRRQQGKSLDEYDFYPYTSTRENFAEFSLRDFRLGMHYFLMASVRRWSQRSARPTKSCSRSTAEPPSSTIRVSSSTITAASCG